MNSAKDSTNKRRQRCAWIVSQAVDHTLEKLEPRRLFAAVAVDTEQVFQTIRGIGGNYAQGRKTGSTFVNDSVGQYTLDNLGPQHARVGIPLKAWEPANDNADPNTANYGAGGFVDSGNVRNVFLLMKDLSDRGIPITLSVWDAPDWMVSNPWLDQQRTIAPGNYGELAESIVNFVKTARDKYGVKTIDALSLNESNGGYFILATAQEEASIIKTVGQRFDADGQANLKWLVGDTTSPNSLYTYAKTILDDPDARPYLGAISYHSWGALTTTDATFTKIRDLGALYGKEIWCEEVGYDSGLYQYPDTFKTWSYATKLAQTYSKVLNLSGSTVANYWEYQNDYPLVDKSTLKPNPAYYIVKQLSSALQPGSQIISTKSDTSTLMTLGARDASRDTFFLQLINTSTSDEIVTINGLPSTALELFRGSLGGANVDLGSYNPSRGILTLTVPADSIATLTGKLAVPSPWSAATITDHSLPGSATYSNGAFRLSGTGNGWLSGSGDNFEFVSQPANENASIVTRVTDLPATGEAGVMMREGTGSADALFALSVNSNGVVTLSMRSSAGASSQAIASLSGYGAGTFLRLIRQGPLFVASVSRNGVDWTDAGSISLPSFSSSMRLGLVADSGNNGSSVDATFDEVTAAALPPSLTPARFSAKTSTLTTPQIDLAWTDINGSETGFEIERSTDGTSFARIVTVATNSTSYADKALVAGQRYYYRSRSINAAGNSDYTPVAIATAPRIFESEQAAFNAVSFDTNYSGYTGTSFGNFKNLSGSWLEWTVDASQNATYSLDWRYAQTTDRALEIKVDGVVVNPSYTFKKTTTLSSWTYASTSADLAAGTHKIRLTTIGQDGPNIDHLRVRPVAPAAPASVAVTPIDGQLKLTWIDGGGTAATNDEFYRVERSTDGINFTEIDTTSANATSFVDPTADRLTAYTYQIRAENGAGDSTYSTRVVGAVPLPPAMPGNVSATALSSSSIALAWTDAATDETGYRAEISTDGVNFTTLATLAANATSFTADGLTAGVAYYFRVRSLGPGGASAYTAASAATPLLTPTNVVATATSKTQVSLSWDAVNGAVGYSIERSTSGGTGLWVSVGSVNGTSFADDGLAPATTYSYRVRASNEVTSSEFSAATSATTPAQSAPVADAGDDQSGNEGSGISFSGSFTDADDSKTSTHTYSWDFGDGSGIVADTLTPTHTYVDNGVYTVTFTVTSADGQTSISTATATVENVAPVVDAGSDMTASAIGAAVAFNGSFADAGTLDTHTIAWDFGDGGTSTGGLTSTHAFAAAGTYTVTLTVTDNDGAQGVDVMVVTVPQATRPPSRPPWRPPPRPIPT